MEKAIKGKVLIVDDEKANIITLTYILSSEYTIYAAKNGEDGIELAEKYLPDVILLDILMPEMDGYEVFFALKSSEKTRDIPVIFITALSKDGDEEKGLALGAADYITKPFSPTVVKLRLGNQIKMLDQMRVIEQLSLTDQLTGIPNRRSFDARLNTEWGRAIREGTPISILMIDVDKFKNYNDTYGHQQGDIALQSFAKAFAGVFKRHSDFAARWGGEEFVALLTNTDEAGALDVAEQIRKMAEDMEIPCLNRLAAKITVSIGVHTRTNENSCTVDKFISGADEALYAAKNKGRNRVCHFSASSL